MDPLIDMSPDTWIAWQAAFPGADDEDELAALRNYIWQAARDAHTDDPCRITAEWVNKKLPTVGVADRIDAVSTYTLRVPVSGHYTTEVSAPDRAEAERLFASMIGGTRTPIRDATPTGPVEFVDGPEDVTSGVLPDDAPTTVGATLDRLREVILLAVVAGPGVCVPGANEMLTSFGLAPIPERRTFKVTRPVMGPASTTVEAYDELSAQRVAEWRWENRHTGWRFRESDLVEAGGFTVMEA